MSIQREEGGGSSLNRRQFLWVAGLTPLVLSSQACRSVDHGGSEQTPLSVMTFNLRFASAKPPHAWPQRRPLNHEVIRMAAPDVIGTQEGIYAQLKDMAADNPTYGWLGLGREGGSRGEYMAVFYRQHRLEPLEYDHFWLSDTPEVMGSTHWGNTCKRMATWIKFRDRVTQREFYFLNTHLDHQVQVAREKGAQLILDRINAWKTTLPVIVTGDFNCAVGNRAYEIFVKDGGFADTWQTAGEHRGEDISTFHGYEGKQPKGDRIDWILTRGTVQCDTVEILTYTRDGEYPSDHFPLMARLRLG